VYAQAYQLYRTGFQFWLDSKEQALVEQNNARFRAMSLEEELISAYYEPGQEGDAKTRRLQAHQIMANLQSKGYFGRLNTVTIGKVLALKGFTQKKSNGISKWLVKDKILKDDHEA
jgi:predicted P-loop ATPase